MLVRPDAVAAAQCANTRSGVRVSLSNGARRAAGEDFQALGVFAKTRAGEGEASGQLGDLCLNGKALSGVGG